jgi:hypothetical protein
MLALGTQYIASHVIPELSLLHPGGHWSVQMVEFLISRPILVVLVLSSEWFIRTKLWRWRWFHPELDFAGTWKGISTYTDRHVGSGALPPPVHHEARIEQDCLTIRLIPAKGTAFFLFESTAVNLIDAQHLVYSYHVKYKTDPRFPDETYGYEELNTVGKKDATGRPTELTGWFSQCPRRNKSPVYSGTVVFTRNVS